MCRFMEIKSKEPKLTQKQICNQLGYSDSTNKRYRDDISMDSPHNRNIYRKKNNKTKTTLTHKPNENSRKNEVTKNYKKIDIKDGSILENNHPDENIKFITIARKLVDNVQNSHFLNR